MRGWAPGALLLLPLAQLAPYQCRWSELTLALLPQGQGASLKAALTADKTWEVTCIKDTSSPQLAAFLVPLILFKCQGNILSLSVGGRLSVQGAVDMSVNWWPAQRSQGAPKQQSLCNDSY